MPIVIARTRYRFAVLVVGLATLIGLWLGSPSLVFDHSTPGYDRNWERNNGIEIAWGPKPRTWLILADPNCSIFTGREWYYRVFEAHCTKWLEERNMRRPPASNTN